ncbi:MAG: S-methyl-5-thioribose-1-phosphate isomerase [Oscillospiraceae bacterium]|nr:S-methyl-5-thioribose-1-phosphate isomerase [Oscillospiraceae bacterium]
MEIDRLTVCDTVSYDENKDKLVIIDQTKLPGKTVFLNLCEKEEIFEAIRTLQVRGAPAIGVAAAIGIYVISNRFETESYDEFTSEFSKVKSYLVSSRPTAVNLSWALERMEKVVSNNKGLTVSDIKTLLKKEALEIRDEDIKVCRAIGENGLTLLKDGDGILTHCNAGRLAAVRYGTALAPIHVGKEKGINFKVFTDETRPLLQGARLSSYELSENGIDTTVICDNMASCVMKQGWVQAVLVGCDRVAANGDAANKIGTSGVAVLAKHYGIPFYVCAPLSTIDMACPDGESITIEERSPDEVTEMWYKERMAPKNVKVYNPAFDVTDASLITAFITEKGVIYPPFDENFKKLF